MNKSALVGIAGLGLFVAIALVTTRTEAETDTITLSDSNTVSLNMPIMPDTANDIQTELLSKSDALGKNDVIYLVLNSPGGSIDAGNSIIALAKGLPQRVDTISLFSASMAFQITQNLGKRYIVDHGTMMSHRAAIGGLSGQVPGNAFARLYYILESITKLDQNASDRAGMGLEDYQRLIADELWMNSENAVSYKFADKVVKIRCDNTLRGPGRAQLFNWIFGRVTLKFHKCPLITEPVEQGGDEKVLEVLAKPKEQLVRTFGYTY